MFAILAHDRDIFTDLKMFVGEPEHEFIFRGVRAFVMDPPPTPRSMNQLSNPPGAIEVADDPAPASMVLQAVGIDATVCAERRDQHIAVLGIALRSSSLARQLHDDAAEGGGKLTGCQRNLLGMDRDWWAGGGSRPAQKGGGGRP